MLQTIVFTFLSYLTCAQIALDRIPQNKHLFQKVSGRVALSSFSSNSTSVGFVAQADVRYRVTPNWSGFVEWKYNRATLSHDNLAGSGLNVEGTYAANLIAVGVGYHF